MSICLDLIVKIYILTQVLECLASFMVFLHFLLLSFVSGDCFKFLLKQREVVNTN